MAISYCLNFIKYNIIHKNKNCAVQYSIGCVVTLHNGKSSILRKSYEIQ